MIRYEGPCEIECEEKCEVPPGAVLAAVPPQVTRHDWGDVMICPNDGCDRAFMVVTPPSE